MSRVPAGPEGNGAPRRCDAGTLELGGGLEVLLAATIEGTPAGEFLDVVTPSRAVALELPGWARSSGHEATDEWKDGDGDSPAWVVRIRRGPGRRFLAGDLPRRGEGLPLRKDGALHTGDLRAVDGSDVPETAPATGGFLPVGAVPEAGAPRFDWGLNQRDRLWADEIADLTESASAAQWDATVDVPWAAAKGLPDDVERAVAQVMTFIAQNEYAALYVPARFLGQVNPQLTEVLLWLSSHVHDEARHVEVFTKRALVGGGRGYALASTELSLQTLLEEHDFTAAALLLNVLGEGTFLDLLGFVERHAPDAATAAAAKLAHRDETRHVHFGISHVRRTIGLDPHNGAQLAAAVEKRASKLTLLSGFSPMLTESLTIMAAGSLGRAELAEGAAAVSRLMSRMEENRVRRLRAAGFDDASARHLSDLHTPNLM